MSKFVITASGFNTTTLCAGEIEKETDKKVFTTRIEGCPFSFPGVYFKKLVVFETENKEKIIRLMAVYTMIQKQHDDVVKAANKSFKANIDVIIGQSS